MKYELKYPHIKISCPFVKGGFLTKENFSQEHAERILKERPFLENSAIVKVKESKENSKTKENSSLEKGVNIPLVKGEVKKEKKEAKKSTEKKESK